MQRPRIDISPTAVIAAMVEVGNDGRIYARQSEIDLETNIGIGKNKIKKNPPGNEGNRSRQ